MLVVVNYLHTSTQAHFGFCFDKVIFCVDLPRSYLQHIPNTESDILDIPTHSQIHTLELIRPAICYNIRDIKLNWGYALGSTVYVILCFSNGMKSIENCFSIESLVKNKLSTITSQFYPAISESSITPGL